VARGFNHPNKRKYDDAKKSGEINLKGCRDRVSIKQSGLARFTGMHHSGFFMLTLFRYIFPSVVLYEISKCF
jgi:hypothetical protein